LSGSNNNVAKITNPSGEEDTFKQFGFEIVWRWFFRFGVSTNFFLNKLAIKIAIVLLLKFLSILFNWFHLFFFCFFFQIFLDESFMLFGVLVYFLLDFFFKFFCLSPWELAYQRRVYTLSFDLDCLGIKVTHLNVELLLEQIWHCGTNFDGNFLFLTACNFTLHWRNF
jgi:hypothetical protein